MTVWGKEGDRNSRFQNNPIKRAGESGVGQQEGRMGCPKGGLSLWVRKDRLQVQKLSGGHIQ